MSTASSSAPAKRPADQHEEPSKRSRVERDSNQKRKNLRLAVVCSSNQNRSMEAHSFLARKGFNVKSYGSGNQVKIPGTSVEKPNCYEFGKVSYDEIYQDLESQDAELYRQNGMLKMVDRNRKIKHGPERFQDESDEFDVVITCEARVFDQVNESFDEREQVSQKPVHVVNVEIKDNHESATLGALKIVDLAEKLEQVEDLDDGIEDAISTFENDTEGEVLHSLAFY